MIRRFFRPISGFVGVIVVVVGAEKRIAVCRQILHNAEATEKIGEQIVGFHRKNAGKEVREVGDWLVVVVVVVVVVFTHTHACAGAPTLYLFITGMKYMSFGMQRIS